MANPASIAIAAAAPSPKAICDRPSRAGVVGGAARVETGAGPSAATVAVGFGVAELWPTAVEALGEGPVRPRRICVTSAMRGSPEEVQTRSRRSYSPSVIPDVSQIPRRLSWTGVSTASVMANHVSVGSFGNANARSYRRNSGWAAVPSIVTIPDTTWPVAGAVISA